MFLDDNRLYATHLYGNGMPLDNNSFEYLDISELKPVAMQVNCNVAGQSSQAGGETA